MKILITGNMGYVGPLVVRHLRQTFPSAVLVGYDSSLFGHCLTGGDVLAERRLDQQYFGDTRELPDALLAGVDAVVHLAAISNDPMGDRFEAVTDDINHLASVRLATAAARMGVGHFVFASSCSVYGVAAGGPRRETDPLNPKTAYARSKIATEIDLAAMPPSDMVITSLRFATACGMSDRLRLDLVLNDFVACAMTTGEISVLSDGTPWRPLIDVRDMARAIEWAIVRPADAGGRVLAINAGCAQGNRQVRDLAHAVAAEVPGAKVTINTAAPADSRSYQVDFSLFRDLAPLHQPQVDLIQSIRGLREGLEAFNFRDSNFRKSRLVR
ncbi:MAG TPA: SDR family oxidoreductase, partial [Rhodopila sp.]